jgi:hypothetical protein
LSDVLDQVVENTRAEGQVSVADLLEALNTRSYGPVLLLPALLAVSPVGAIPGMAIVTGSLIILIAGQALLGQAHPWVPKKLLGFSFPQDKLEQTSKRMRPWIVWSEQVLSHRLTVLTRPPVFHVVVAVCVGLAALFYPLALVPMAVAVPGTAVILLSLGLTARDGAMVIAGFVMAGVAGWMAYYFWPF